MLKTHHHHIPPSHQNNNNTRRSDFSIVCILCLWFMNKKHQKMACFGKFSQEIRKRRNPSFIFHSKNFGAKIVFKSSRFFFHFNILVNGKTVGYCNLIYLLIFLFKLPSGINILYVPYLSLLKPFLPTITRQAIPHIRWLSTMFFSSNFPAAPFE